MIAVANVRKSSRALKGASGREAGVGNKARSREGTPVSTGSTETPTDEQKDSVRRLAALCQKPSPAEASLRMKRIVAIKKAIAAGTYRISAADIADQLIDHMLKNRPPRT